MDDLLTVPQGAFVLRRPHADPTGSLRAWDAADAYALDHLATISAPIAEREPNARERWLVVNDGFGALAVAGAAAGADVTSWNDSSVALAAAAANLDRNDLDPSSVTFVPATATPEGPFSLVIVKVPRPLAHLQDQLRRLRPLVTADATVIGAGMTKAVHTSTIEAFERAVGPTPTSRARAKARLLLATVDPDLEPPPPSFPVGWTTPDGIEVTGLPNVFSATGLDPGTRLLLDHLPEPAAGATVVDLACGTGVLGATLAARHPDMDLICCDESYEAVEAARQTVGRVTDRVELRVADALDGVADRSADLILLNPPFHAGGARTTAVAERMFVDAERVLRTGGELRVVANRHLGHHATIRRVLGSVTVVASDPRFVVLSAIRR